MNMRAVFFLAPVVLLACGHAPLPSAQAFSEEGLLGDRLLEGRAPLTLKQQAMVWQALLAELDFRLEAGQVEAEELRWLKASLEQAWNAQDKEALPKALSVRAQDFLEKLKTHTLSPQLLEESFLWPLWPVELSSPFGYRIHPLTGERRFHQGVDLKATAQEEVRSTQGGWVLHAGWAGGYGYMVEVLHLGGSFSRYAHLSQVGVRVGEKIQAGTVVGWAGDSGNTTGVHLHFELWKEGRPVDPTLHLPWVWPWP